MQIVSQLLETAGLGRDRLQLRWVSSAEGQVFAEYVTELTEVIREVGPLDREKYSRSLAAAERALEAVPVRWLMGMEKQLTEQENVYHEKLDPDHFQMVLKQMAEEEYQKALLFEVLKEGPKTVRQMAAGTGLSVYTVSLRLNDLERSGQADFSGHEGTTPRFRLTAV